MYRNSTRITNLGNLYGARIKEYVKRRGAALSDRDNFIEYNIMLAISDYVSRDLPIPTNTLRKRDENHPDRKEQDL